MGEQLPDDQEQLGMFKLGTTKRDDTDLDRKFDVIEGGKAGKSDARDHYDWGVGKPLPGKCSDTHPALKMPGTEFVVHGGSCSRPVRDAKVYVGLDRSMSFTARNWPWKKGYELLFPIPDYGVPSSAREFAKLIDWIKKQVDGGVPVHVGCIGGHGRTGMVLAALVSLYGEKDAVTYVREHYCKRAVESAKQVDFLHQNFGIKKVKGAKTLFKSPARSPSYGTAWKSGKDDSEKFTVSPMPGHGCIWDEPSVDCS